MGDLLDIGPDDPMEEQDVAEAAQRKEELMASIRGLAKDLFSKAVDQAKQAKAAHQQLRTRLAAKKRR
eukprot:6070816-Pyramimonas_sp.AAC.1